MDRNEKGHWAPGNRGNPSGLGKPDLAEAIRAKTSAGEIADLLIEIVARGATADDSGLVTEWSPELRMKALEKLIVRGWGKEKQIVEVTGVDGTSLFDPAKLEGDALERYTELARSLAGLANESPTRAESSGSGTATPLVPSVH